ncbi:MAG: hypothetical protein ACXADC_02590 [Candidatus Thorarchaeota archaeon]|jgi:hypothetical protein
MRYHSIAIIVLVITVSSSMVTVFAQSNHSLEWGISEAEEFVYVLQRKLILNPSQSSLIETQLPFVGHLDQGAKVIAKVEGLEAMPADINSYDDIPIANISLMRENDSLPIASDIETFVVPTNDWPLLNEMAGFGVIEGQDLVDTQTEWGYVSSGSFSSAGTIVNFRIELRYEKENGTLNYIRLRYSALGQDLIDVVFVQWHVGMPTILPPEVQLSLILITAIVVIASSVCVFVGYRWYKSKKPLVQQLGE